MSKKNLLKEAIADAKAVRATALANAKLALEEAFTPKLQSMISAKIQQEMEDEDMEGVEDDEMEMEEDLDSSEIGAGDNVEPEYDNDTEDAVGTDNIVEDDEEMADAELAGDESMEDEEDIELESIIKELEDEMGDESMEDEEETVDEVPVAEEVEDEMGEEDEELDINEIIRALREDDSFTGDATPDGDADAESKEEEELKETVKSLRAELREAYDTISTMKSTLSETNLLNAKLLFSNKLFKSYALNESQKMKVIDNFDRAQTLREVKLIYATLAESFKMPAKRRMTESASKPVSGTAPKKSMLNEQVDFTARMKQLAGINKK